MIPYEELERALARWKSRTQPAGESATPAHGGAAAPDDEDDSAMVQEMEVEAYSQPPRPPTNGMPKPRAQTGEISLEEEVIETYDDDDER
jgi:hypothetical protein